MDTTSAGITGLALRETPRSHGISPYSSRIVLVHGAMDTGASFSRLIGHLEGFDVISYDRRGYGGSRLRGRTPAHLAEHVDDLLALLDGQRSMVLAHSLGGVIALAAAQRAPQLVQGILAYEAPMPWEPWWPPLVLPEDVSDEVQVRAAAERFLRRHLGDSRWEALDGDRREAFLSHGKASRRRPSQFQFWLFTERPRMTGTAGQPGNLPGAPRRRSWRRSTARLTSVTGRIRPASPNC
jgi:pimeloyl-ACP methyl ester carboxylesterase